MEEPLFQQYYKKYWQLKKRRYPEQYVKDYNKKHNEAKTLFEKCIVLKQFLIETGIYQKTLESRAHKNEMESVWYRDLGDVVLSKKNALGALLHYNHSVRLAKQDTEDLALAYAHRSAVYFQLDQYKYCIDDIERARESHFPDNLLPKLLTRLECCKSKLKINELPPISRHGPLKFRPSLTYIPHQNIPFIIRGLELKTEAKYGKGIYAITDLHAGDVIAIEKPIIRSLSCDIKDRCCYCFKENYFSLLPCEHCTAVMFCSSSCRKKAYAEFHKYECSMIDAILEIKQDCVLLTMRITWLALRAFQTTHEWRKFVSSIHYENIDNFKLDFNSDNLVDDYSKIMSLQCNESGLDENTRFFIILTATKVEELIMRDAVLKTHFTNIQDCEFLQKILLQHSKIAALNSRSFTFPIEVRGTAEYPENLNYSLVQMGYEINSIGSLFNHSCIYNTVKISHLEMNVFYILRPVKKGEQLFVNYGGSSTDFTLTNKEQRKEEHKKFGIRKCECEACLCNYPTMNEIANHFNHDHLCWILESFEDLYDVSDERLTKSLNIMHQTEKSLFHPNLVLHKLEWVVLTDLHINAREYD